MSSRSARGLPSTRELSSLIEFVTLREEEDVTNVGFEPTYSNNRIFWARDRDDMRAAGSR
jgi:hypothetical protein